MGRHLGLWGCGYTLLQADQVMKCGWFSHLKGPSETLAPPGCTLTPAWSLLLLFPLVCPFRLAASLITARRHLLSGSSCAVSHLDLFRSLEPSLSFNILPRPPFTLSNPPPSSSSPFGCLSCLSSLCLSNLLLLPSCTCHISRSSAVSRFAGVRRRPRSRCNGGIFNKSGQGITAWSGGGEWASASSRLVGSFTGGL